MGLKVSIECYYVSNTKRSSLENIHASNVIYAGQVVFRNICTHICIKIVTCEKNFNENTGHEYVREQWGVHGRIWREEREEGMKKLYYNLKRKKWKENQVFRRHTNDEVSAMKKIPLWCLFIFNLESGQGSYTGWGPSLLSL